MRLIISAPDELIEAAMDVARVQMPDYAARFAKPGWGWTVYRNGHHFWVCGIKGGISVRSNPAKSDPGVRAISEHGNLPPDELALARSALNNGGETGSSSVKNDQQADHAPGAEG